MDSLLVLQVQMAHQKAVDVISLPLLIRVKNTTHLSFRYEATLHSTKNRM